MMKPMSRMTRKPRMFGRKPKKLFRACWTLSPILTAARGMNVPPDEASEMGWTGGRAPAGRRTERGARSPGRFPVHRIGERLSRSRPDPLTDMPPATSAWMRIGEISRRTGVNPDVLRAWERRYRLLRPRRTAGGTRLYSAADETRVRLMQHYIADGLPPAQAAEMVTAARLSVRPGQAASVPPAEVAAAHAE